MADKNNDKLKINNPYNYKSKLAVWREFATYNSEETKCSVCPRANAHKTVLLEDGRHICWYSWIKKDVNYGTAVKKANAKKERVKTIKQVKTVKVDKPKKILTTSKIVKEKPIQPIVENKNSTPLRTPLLSINKLNKYFVKSGKMVKVLDDINFDVYEKDFFGIIGESGSGKSTTGKCAIRLYSTSSGTITFDNQIINQPKMNKKSRFWLTQNMSMIFQDPMSSLNPRKNVLSLIAEPLVINKTIAKDTTKFIEKCHQVNPYFQNTFKYQDFILSKQYLIPFYKNNISLFKQAAIDIRTLRLNINRTDDIFNILETVETTFKKSIKDLNVFNKAIYDLIDENYSKFETRKLHETENDYYQTEKALLHEKKLLKNPVQFYEINEKIEAQKEEIKNIEEKFVSKYKVENLTRLNSIKSSITSEIKASKQDYQLTDSLTAYIYKYTRCLILKDTLHAISALNKNINIELTDLNLFSNYISSKIESKYEDLINDIILLTKYSDQLDACTLANTSEDEIMVIFNKYQEVYNKIHSKTEVLKGTNFTEEDKEVASKIKSLNKNSEVIQTKHEKLVESLKAKLESLKSERDTIKNQSNKQKTSPDFESALSDFEAAKMAREIFIQEDNAEFASQSMPLINAQKNDLKSLDLAFYKSWVELKKAATEMKEKLTKLLSPNVSKVKSLIAEKSAEVLLIERNIENKLQVIDAINFEYTNLLDEVNLFRMLRNKSKHLLMLQWKRLSVYITRQYVYKSLEEVGLKSEHAYRYPHEFSGGQRQRIVIARALISNPKLIIADEPISALDVSIQAQVINIMKRLAEEKGITFLLIAHDLSMVRYVSNRLIIMHKGRIVEKGDTEEIFKNPVHPYTKSLIKASPELSKIHVDLSSFSAVMDYDSKYTTSNQPLFHSVSDKHEHFVLASESQIAKWKK
ncbi:MAG: ATP-binding cassette domain-containing protein [Mycoplasma sp.]